MAALAFPTLPTLDVLGQPDLSNVSPEDVATQWFAAFSTAISKKNSEDVLNLFFDDCYWKDILSLSWNFRSVRGKAAIKHLLEPALRDGGFSALHLIKDSFSFPVLNTPFPDLTFLCVSFAFETKDGKGTGVCNLVPISDQSWKVYTIFTCLDSLKAFPEKVGNLRNHNPNHGTWLEDRCREIDFVEKSPVAIIIGAGHTGLEIAARLKFLGVPALIVDQKSRVGDNWRDRYKALCLHDIVWYNDTPYLGFPSTWPVFTPALKLADWLEHYAEFLELSVWMSSTIQSSKWNKDSKTWDVQIQRGTIGTRKFTVKHLIFAPGFGGGQPLMPDLPGKEQYQGTVIHSSKFISAQHYIGKKAVVVGACNSAHDIAQDFYNHGVDVTMFQRSSTFVISAQAVAGILGAYYKEGFPVGLADHLSNALPFDVSKPLLQRVVPHIAQTLDKDLLDGLAKVGFKTNLGIDRTGLMPLFLQRGGGYYIDVGTSQNIIDKKIKLKSGSSIERFTDHGVRFADGQEIEADVVVFATGYGDARQVVYDICGPEVAAKVKPVWGLDNEGLLNGIWRDSGHEGIWFALGNLGISRYHSIHLALQIKAIEEGIFTKRES